LLHAFEDKHAQSVLKEGRMPGIETHDLGRNAQATSHGGAQCYEFGDPLGVPDLPERAQWALQDEGVSGREVPEDFVTRLGRGNGEIELFLSLGQRREPFGVDTNRDGRQSETPVGRQGGKAGGECGFALDQSRELQGTERVLGGVKGVGSCVGCAGSARYQGENSREKITRGERQDA
jgi:hypothetical protein